MTDVTDPARSVREPVLSPVDRVSEMLFGLFMALTFTGAASVAEQGNAQIRTMFIAALGCNLAWGLVDAVMYLVRTVTDRGRKLTLIHAVRAAPDAKAGCALIEQSLSKAAALKGHSFDRQALGARDLGYERLDQLTVDLLLAEIEAIRGRVMALSDLPERPAMGRDDALAALAIFLIVVAATFPVVLPFMMFADVGVAKNISRVVALLMLFIGGLALGRYAGYGSWRVGVIMVGLGSGLVAAINALGG